MLSSLTHNEYTMFDTLYKLETNTNNLIQCSMKMLWGRKCKEFVNGSQTSHAIDVLQKLNTHM